MKAVFEIGGKQLIYEEGDVFLSERVHAEVGDTITVDRVLSIIDGDTTKIGEPVINGASVELKVLYHDKGKKVTIQKYRPKINYRIRKGHKQCRSQLKLTKINTGE